MFENFDMNAPLGEKLVFALQVAFFGMLMVFLLLIILAICIMIISRVVRAGESVSAKKHAKGEPEAGAAVPDSMDGRSLYALLGTEGREGWRPYVDLEHATCYAADNYWCALTDGHEKYVWNFHSGAEQFFDLDRDPHELHNAAADPDYGDRVDHWRAAMARHLSERGEPYVVDGRPVPLKKTILYGPNYPKRP